MLDEIEKLARNYIRFIDDEYHYSEHENYENGFLGNPFYSIAFDWTFGHGLIDGGHHNFLKFHCGEEVDEIIKDRIANRPLTASKFKIVCKILLTLHTRIYYHQLLTKMLEEMCRENEVIHEEIKYMIFLNGMLANYLK